MNERGGIMFRTFLFLSKIIFILLILIDCNVGFSGNNVNIDKSKYTEDKWVLIKNEPLKFIPELMYSVYELERPPYKEVYDKIRLHRLVNSSIGPKATVFILPGTYSSAEQIVSDKFLVNAVESAIEHKSDFPELSQKTLEDINTIPFRSITYFLALNGYDVFSMDYRTHFVPKNLSSSSTKFMADWGWDFFMEEAKVAIKKAKEISLRDKIFLAGESFGGMLAMNYATMNWREDLMGLILLDGGNGGRWRFRVPLEVWKLVESEFLNNLGELPEWSIVDGKMSPNLLQSLIYTLFDLGILGYTLDASGRQTKELTDVLKLVNNFLKILEIPISLDGGISNYDKVQQAMINDIFDEPIDPITGIYLKPYNYTTDKPYDTYLEWVAAYNSDGFPEGSTTNYVGGENTKLGIALIEATFDRFWPLISYLGSVKMFEFEITTSNEPAELIGPLINTDKLPIAVRETLIGLLDLIREKSITTDENRSPIKQLNMMLTKSYKKLSSEKNYSKYYKDIDIPLISFESRFGLLLWGPFTPGIKSKDVTNGGEYPFLGHLDIFIGKNNDKLVNIPVLNWLEERK
jgi:hypothetical protein